MVGRRSGVSGKQKKAELWEGAARGRRATPATRNHAARVRRRRQRHGAAAAAAAPLHPAGVEEGRTSGSTQALKDDAVVQAPARRRAASARAARAAARERGAVVVGRDAARPAWSAGEAASAQDARERAAFREWEEGVHARFADSELSPFEHNVEVWRQLWRVLERCDVLCIIADARNPLLHIPAALYAHLADERQVRTVIVLTKVDLVSEAHLASWTAELRRRFAKAHLATFSSKGRAVGGADGGGVAARRRRRAAPLSAAQRAAVRAYVEEIATACAVTLPAAGGGAGGGGGYDCESTTSLSAAESEPWVGSQGSEADDADEFDERPPPPTAAAAAAAAAAAVGPASEEAADTGADGDEGATRATSLRVERRAGAARPGRAPARPRKKSRRRSRRAAAAAATTTTTTTRVRRG